MLDVNPAHHAANSWRDFFVHIAPRRPAIQQQIARTVVLLAVACGLAGCHAPTMQLPERPAVVGTWLVQMPGAPFPWHLFSFHSDGTVQQSNPDAGDANTSDSSLMGSWKADGDAIASKMVEVSADRATHKFTGRTDIVMHLTVTGSALSGTATAAFTDAEGHPSHAPVTATMTGERITPETTPAK